MVEKLKYAASFPFDNDTVGEPPANWTTSNKVLIQEAGYSHNKLMLIMYDNGTSWARKSIDNMTSGYIEFHFRVPSGSDVLLGLMEDGNYKCKVGFEKNAWYEPSKTYYFDGGTKTYMNFSPQSGSWYVMRFHFDVSGTWDLSIWVPTNTTPNGNNGYWESKTSMGFSGSSPDKINQIIYETRNEVFAGRDRLLIDAIGIDGVSGYEKGDNMDPEEDGGEYDKIKVPAVYVNQLTTINEDHTHDVSQLEKVAVGTYTGDGAGTNSNWNGYKRVNIGFRPKLVNIFHNFAAENGWGTLFTSIDAGNSDVCLNIRSINEGSGGITREYRLRIHDNGFDVADDGANQHPNRNNDSYKYVAMG